MPSEGIQLDEDLMMKREGGWTKTATGGGMPKSVTGSQGPPGTTGTLNEVEVGKEMVDFLLRAGQARVLCEAEKRTRSDVWKYFGRVRLMTGTGVSGSGGISEGQFCKDVVACVGCHMVYLYRSKSQGTSTLRHHKCPYVFKVLGKDMQRMNQEGDSRHGTREMTPEAEDRKPVMPSLLPPIKAEHMMSSPPPQSVHPLGLHSGLQSSGGPLSGVNMSSGGRRLSSGGTPPPQNSNSGKEGGSPPQQLLCVRWGNFDSNIVSMFTKLRSQEHFVDVTLWCEGKTIKCHKMILSACSTYFETLLTENPNPHPIIFLKDMRYWEITALVEFMYRGEVSIHQEKLQSLLRAAESLQIKGLGSPSANEGGGLGGSQESGLESSGMDDDLSNGTMDMSTNSNNNNNNNSSSLSSHNQSSNNHTLSHLHNNNHSNNNNNNSIHANLANLASSLGQAHLHNTSSPSSVLSQHSLLNSMNVGMDLSNHGSSIGSSGGHGINLHNSPMQQPLPLSLSSALNDNNNNNNNNNININQSSGGGIVPAKRRKKETPRRIDIPRAALPLPVFNSTMASDIEDDVDDGASDDSMAAHERNHVDNFKQDNIHPEMTYDDDEEDGDGQENYGDHDPGSSDIKN